jgi:hypothetical protein
MSGARQHQPPGDMILTNLGIWASNVSIFGLRFHACLFSALAGTWVYGLTRKLSGSKIFALLCAGFFSAHHLVFKYGYEARPISYGVFTELLFIAAVLAHMHETEQKNLRTGIYLTAATFLFLSSVGLQPPFIVGVAIVFFAVMAIEDKKYIKTGFHILAGLIMFFPIQIIIFQNSDPRFTLTDGFSITRTWEQLSLTNFVFLKTFYDPFGYICLGVFFIYLAVLFYRKKPINHFLGFIIFLLAGFPLALVPYFRAHINWPLNDYYMLTIFPLLFLLLSGFWGEIFPRINSRWVSVAFALLLFSMASIDFEFKDRFRSLHGERQDLKSAFHAIEQNMEEGDLILSFCLNSYAYCPGWVLSEPFYLGHLTHDLRGESSVAEYRKSLDSRKIPKNLFFMYHSGWSPEDAGTRFLLASFYQVSVYKVPTNTKPAESVIDFFTPYFQAALAKNEVASEPLAYLVASYDATGNKAKVKELLEIYKNRPKISPDNYYLETYLLNAGKQ